MKFKHYIIPLLALGAASCLSDGTETFVFTDPSIKLKDPTEADKLNIPEDEDASKAPVIKTEDQNTEIANAPTIVMKKGAYGYIPICGIRDKDGNWLQLKGTVEREQNTWLTIDYTPKGVDIIDTKNVWSQNSFRVPIDVVFLINNSQSMSEEVDVIVRDIARWVDLINEHGIDLRVGFVSYDEGTYSIHGALDLAEPNVIVDYLRRDNSEGIDRANGFTGANADMLKTAAETENYIGDFSNECEMLALCYAHDRFSFRPSSNRIYINFTDEPNQPGGRSKWSVDMLRQQNGYWEPTFGTVYCVYSGTTNFTPVPQVTEQPWLMSEFTGGIAEFCAPDFKDMSLLNLVATQAITHSYLLRFRTTSKYYDDILKHKVTITVATPDGTKAEKSMSLNFIQED